MSSAADNFHPGFSPESSLMLLSLAGLLACAASVEPSRHVAVVLKSVDVFSISRSTYSYGNSTGLTPVSLLIPRQGNQLRREYKAWTANGRRETRNEKREMRNDKC